MSIAERIARIKEDSLNWQNRANRSRDHDEFDNVKQIRQKLCNSELCTDNFNMEDVSACQINKQSGGLQRVKSMYGNSTSLDPVACLPLEPIQRLNQVRKKQASFPRLTNDLPSVDNSDDLVRRAIAHQKMNHDMKSFFRQTITDVEEDYPNENVAVSVYTPTDEGDNIREEFKLLTKRRQAIRPKRHKSAFTLNSSILFSEQKDTAPDFDDSNAQSEVPRIQSCQRSQPMLRRCDSNDTRRRDDLSHHALAALMSKENFIDVKSTLRSKTESSPQTTVFNLQLLPYKSTMLLHIKGRRRVQVRLVHPSVESMNSGDCFVLVTPNTVFAWFGSEANVFETNKARELASWIHKSHELCYCGNDDAQRTNTKPNNVYTSIYESNTQEFTDGSDNSANEAFWKALGYARPQVVNPAGPLHEDEYFETFIQQSNRLYEVTLENLKPCNMFWGVPVKHTILKSDKAYVFDFGSEIYLWTGKLISSELRSSGYDLVRQCFRQPYDYDACPINPLNPNKSHTTIPGRGLSRPDWCLVGKVTENGETVLFKEKFSDWTNASSIQVKFSRKSECTDSNDSHTFTSFAMHPYPADDICLAFCNAPPSPSLLTLESRFIGRGGDVCLYEDGIVRRFSVVTESINVWYISDFSHHELTPISFGQFHEESNYVIKWSYNILYGGNQEVGTRSNPNLGERCAFFYWQGSQSKVTEKGTAALTTVNLDEERSPHIRVIQGKEPPVFCHIFTGRMVVYEGKHGACKQCDARLFFVRGEIPIEGHLVEVPANMNSLRSQGVFVLVEYTNDYHPIPVINKVFLWCGRLAVAANKETGNYIVEQLKNTCPPEFGNGFTSFTVVRECDTGAHYNEFLRILSDNNRITVPICSNAISSHNHFAIWQFTRHENRQIGISRLHYCQECRSCDLQKNIPNRYNTTPDDAMQQVTDISEIKTFLRTMSMKSAFPFYLSELYHVHQPSLFLIVSARPVVYIWQGWQPEVKFPECSTQTKHKSLIESDLIQYSSSITNHPRPNSFYSQGTRDPGNTINGRSNDAYSSIIQSESVTTGSEQARFGAFKRAAMKTAQAVASRLGARAYLIYAGLEPNEFLCLFPPYYGNMDAAIYHQTKEGKVVGQMDSVDEILKSQESATYSLQYLQQRPLPPELDVTCLENYLDDVTFENEFHMTREQYNALPKWKKCKLKKPLGLF